MRNSVGASDRIRDRLVFRLVMAILFLLFAAAMAPGSAAGYAKKKVPAQEKPNPANTALQAYVARMRAAHPPETTAGAIWNENGRLSRLSSNTTASKPNDLIQVVVSENLTAETDGTVKNQRASSANSSITALGGSFSTSSAAVNLLGQTSGSALNAQGQSATNSSLSTILGGEVVDVLPNGMLVISAARQVEFSQQKQTILLRGLVRPEDVNPQNQVLSTAISSLELEVVGKGIVNDSTHRQNPVVRFIESLLVF